jgi:hypothetical protein
VTPESIRVAIAGDPALQALVPDASAIADALPPDVTLRERFVTERGVVAALGILDGESFLSALDAFAATPLDSGHPLLPYQPGIARQLAWLKKGGVDGGIDVGSAPARQMLDTLVSAGVVDAAAASTIKGLAEVATPVSEMDVRRALWNDDGSSAL